MTMINVLIVLSAADTWTRTDGSKYDSGVWAGKLVETHEKFAQANCEIDVATPGGQKPTIDPYSLDPDIAGPDVERFAAYLETIAQTLEAPLVLADVDPAGYDAVVIPGGHGPVEDLYKDSDMGRILVAADGAGKVIASVCHGPAALLSATDADGKWLFAGRRMTAFSDEEEAEFGTAENAPWLLATRLRESGAQYERGAASWEPHVVQDGRLISGQNPASSGPMADAVLAALR